MLSLVVWMHLNGMNLVTVQATDITQCGDLREAVEEQAGVKRALCISSYTAVAEIIAEGDCNILERRESFANFICTKENSKWTNSK